MSESELIKASINDLSYGLCVSAYRGMSFVPEKRAKQRRQDYVDHMASVSRAFEQFRTPDNEEQIREDLERFRKGYLARLQAKLHADSRTMSSMIAGPSNFPVRSNQKKVEIAERRLRELIEYNDKVLNKLRAKYDPARIASAPVMSDDEDAIEKLQDKLAEHEKLQELMKAANKVCRSKKLDDDAKVSAMVEIGLSDKVARELLQPSWQGIGFPRYELTNNNATIRRLKQRIAKLQVEATEPDKEYEINGVRVVEDTEERRIRLFFEGKPSYEFRHTIKSNGFKWSRYNKAWQRLLNNQARNAALTVCEAFDGVYE